MKGIFVSLAFFCVTLSLFAQTHKCYSDQAVDVMRQKNPAYAAGLDAWRNSIMQQVIQQTPPTGSSRGVVYTIPIVFHVILSSQGQVNSITDVEIQQQVNRLNNDFRKLNSDTNTIRTGFKSLASDIEIEFCLAARDPSGNATTGITRTITTHTASWDPSTEGDDMKDDATGGHDAWNPLKYVNVWIVDILGSQFGGTLGYAYRGAPGIHGDPVDGIVIDFQIGFGPNNRTLTHEMGHYFGLYHTWGTANSCSNDDGVSDTPESYSANYGCDYSTNSCTTTADLPDQIENYMDYADCSVMFTTQQKAVMRNLLSNVRSSLITNNLGCQGLNAAPVANFYASVTSVCAGGAVAFTDNSINVPTSWSWSFPGGSPSTSTQQNPTVTYPANGTYNVSLTATNGFGTDSEVKTGYITVGTGAATTIFSEDFEGSISAWSVVNPDNGLTWEIVSGIGGSLPGDNAARVHLYDYEDTLERDGLVSPIINLSGKSQVSLTFNYAHRRYMTDYRDSLIIYVSINGGNTWPYRVYANAEDNTAAATFATGFLFNGDFIPTTEADWCTASASGVTCPVVNLAAFNGQANFRLKFETYNDYGNNIYLDNILVTGVCSGVTGQSPVVNFTANQISGCDAITVNFSDQSTNTPTSWSWQFTGGSPATSTQQNPTVTYSAPGAYNVSLTASNANGSDSKSVSSYVTVYASPTASITKEDASCPDVNNGSADLKIVGGTAPFTYHWSNGVTTEDLSNAAVGNYSVTLNDAHDCSVEQSTTIDSGPTLQLNGSVHPDSAGTGVGSVFLTVTNGTSPYNFQWSNGSSSAAIGNLNAGTYSVTVTDAVGCQAQSSYTVTNDTATTVSITHIPNDELTFNIYPNPADDLLNVFVKTNFPDNIKLVFYNTIGQTILQQGFGNVSEINASFDLNKFEPGVYFLRIESYGRIAVSRVVVMR